MTGGTGDQSAFGITLVVERQGRGWRSAAPLERQACIIKGHRLALLGIECLRDPAHLRVIAAPVRIGFQLPLQIAGIELSQPRRPSAVAASVEPMTGETGVGRARFGSAVSDHPSILGKAIERTAVRRRTAGQGNARSDKEKGAHPAATVRSRRWFRALALAPALALTAACKAPPDQRQFVPVADATSGKAAIEQVGCGSCHIIPGVAWPQGKVGPELDGLAERALIAGKLPNRPDVLAVYIRNAPALVPGSGMPAMPVSETQARDIAAYLYEQGAD